MKNMKITPEIIKEELSKPKNSPLRDTLKRLIAECEEEVINGNKNAYRLFFNEIKRIINKS